MAVQIKMEGDHVKFTMYFNVVTKDNQGGQVECYGRLPVKNPDALGDKLCENLERLIADTIHDPLDRVYNAYARYLDLEAFKKGIEHPEQQPQLTPEEMAKTQKTLEAANVSFESLIANLPDAMGNNCPNKYNVEMQAKFNDTPQP